MDIFIRCLLVGLTYITFFYFSNIPRSTTVNAHLSGPINPQIGPYVSVPGSLVQHSVSMAPSNAAYSSTVSLPNTSHATGLATTIMSCGPHQAPSLPYPPKPTLWPTSRLQQMKYLLLFQYIS